MLKVISSMAELPLEQLEQVYGQAVDEDYLRYEFFHVPGAMLCLWTENGNGVSALRLESWRDGVLLTGLETAPSYRRRGHARRLLRAVQKYLNTRGESRLYSHILHRNTASIRLHTQCGFRKISDSASLLDGTVTAQMGTFLFDGR